MRIPLDDLPGHRGSVGCRLPDGSLHPDPRDTAAPTSYRAMCSCGWIGGDDHPATDTGRMEAISDWTRHMGPLWAAAPPQWLLARSDSLRDALAELTTRWPLQALGVLAALDRWQRQLIEEAVARARTGGASWSEIGAALGVTRQSAHERFSTAAPRRPRAGTPAAGATPEAAARSEGTHPEPAAG